MKHFLLLLRCSVLCTTLKVMMLMYVSFTMSLNPGHEFQEVYICIDKRHLYNIYEFTTSTTASGSIFPFRDTRQSSFIFKNKSQTVDRMYFIN